VFDYFTVGNGEDPTAAQQSTWNNAPGARRFKQLLKAVMIPLTGDISAMVEATKGQKFIGKIDQKTDSGSNPQFAGSKKNVVSAFYPVGSRATGGAPAPIAGGSPTASAPKTTTLSCPYCAESVPKNTYSAHVAARHPDEA
jgi:hypothetical protein